MLYKVHSPEFKEKFDELIKKSSKIIITSHTSPDDDSISSVLAVYSYISSFAVCEIRIMYTGEKIIRYECFENFDRIEFVEDLSDHIDWADLVIGLDGGQWSRFSKKPEIYKYKGNSICIDRHASPADPFTLSLINVDSPSNSENIYHLFFEGTKIKKSDIEIILLGILGDTGVFSYINPSQTQTLVIGEKLIREGNINIQEFMSRYRTYTKDEFEIVKYLIKNTQYKSVKGWPDLMFTYIDREYIESNTYTKSQISIAGHIYMDNYIRKISGYKWGLIFYANFDGSVGFSGRSLPNNVSVRDLAQRQKLGGGHDRAAGGEYKPTDSSNKVDVQSCIKKMFEWMENNEPLIN